MNSLDLKSAVETLSIEHNIEKEAIVAIIRDVIAGEFAEYLNVIEDNIRVDVSADFKMNTFVIREVVDEETAHPFEISLSSAKALKADIQVGETIDTPVGLEVLSRRNVKKLNSVLMQKLRNIQKEILFREYKTKEGQLISGTYIRRQGRDMFIDIGKTEAKLPWREQSPREFYKQSDKIRTYLKEVNLDENGRLSIILSRTDPNLVKKLFEIEVPEMAEGFVKVKTIVREPGHKTKMAVYSTKTGVEPVGSCVGLGGIRIKAVIKELAGERIDVIPHSTSPKEFLARSLQPAKVVKVLIVNEEEKEALVVVTDDTLSLAIGREGANIKLASRLSGWTIKVKPESQLQQHPEIFQLFSKAEELFSNVESDLHQLTDIDEEILVKLMNAGIMSVAELYEKKIDELSRIEGIGREGAERIRKVLDEMVELVDDEEQAKLNNDAYIAEVEDEIEGVNTDEDIREEIQQVEYLVCPSCSFEFEYKGQSRCPSCNIEFEFEEEVQEIVE